MAKKKRTSKASEATQPQEEAQKPQAEPKPAEDLKTTHGLIINDTADLAARERTTYGLVIRKASDGPQDAGATKTQEIGGMTRRGPLVALFRGRGSLRHLLGFAEREAERRAEDAAKDARFNAACGRVRQCFACPEIKDHWLDQMKPVVSAGGEYAFAAGPPEWPKDKAVVYAVMAICAQEGSAFDIIPRAMRESEWFKANSAIWCEIQRRDIAAELMTYIEADLHGRGLLGDGEPAENPAKPNMAGDDQSSGYKCREWSRPMSKARMMQALGIDGYKRFNALANRCGLDKINHKTYRICLDSLSAREKEKLQK